MTEHYFLLNYIFVFLAIKIKCRPLQRELYETYIRYQDNNAINTNLGKCLIKRI
jgi:hypothetical protein